MSKFIINPSNITRLHGIAFGSTTGQFAGSVVLDDIQFNNGSICMDEREGVPIYSNGSLADGLAVYSQGSNFESTVVQYTSHRTVQWYLNNQYDISVGFEAGALDTVENNGLIISVYFVPNADTYTDPNDVSQTPIQPKIRFSLTNQGTDIQPLGIAEYLGGEIPPNRWLSFTIPFEDFGLWESATVDGFKLKTDGWDSSVTQGTLYIGKIKAAKFVPPPSEESSAFILKSSSLFTYVTITLISFILYF
ncbi:hypothetical protein DFA_12214 [Cavenderia fasciculata]|uniref:Uncharacterized protein n=1 Tax=Cavenderia fasciculata TaxID=261658 RepID=F4QCL4_CACFS|nr:uncharacterized protein DFA_12214 [Cavenderia fasciculata]EGG14442.1 hypothetical protein DFA_12214 [Cavenderia fasciculata]|eukprot:XP_004353851.1 hypothetical protein DFA_12214 [Cavenderia fasciculata]